MLDLSWNPFYLFDRPRDDAWLLDRLGKIKRDHNLDASIEVLPHRISHRKRVELALEYGDGAGEIQLHGVWAVAVAQVPSHERLPIVGERMPAPDGVCWRRVILQCRKGIPIAQSHKVGHVGVDYARILIADVDALRSWEHERSIDGLADYLFWGRDAERVAHKTGAPRVSDIEFGWNDLEEDAALRHAQAVERLHDKFKFASDYRPHSHHWQVMRTARTNSTESGMAEVDGQVVCNFMTTWGDGVFEVHRDLGPEGELVSVRVEMETLPASAGT